MGRSVIFGITKFGIYGTHMLAVRRVRDFLSIEFFVHPAVSSIAMTDSDLALVFSRRSISFTELACKHRAGPSVIVLKTDL